jgi:hypothetical protein
MGMYGYVLTDASQKSDVRSGARLLFAPAKEVGRGLGSGAYWRDRASGISLEMPGMCFNIPNSKSPVAICNAISCAIAFIAGDLEETFMAIRNAPKESERTWMKVGSSLLTSQILAANKSAKHSHRVVYPDSPTLALKRLTSCDDTAQ